MALLLTIVTVSLLVAVTIQYHKTTWQQFLVSNHYKVGTQLEAIADSGINIALALLEQDGKDNQIDSLVESWATVARENFEAVFPAGQLQLNVVDLSGRLPINSLVQSDAGNPNNTQDDFRLMLKQLLLSGAFAIEEETEAQGIVDALVDWIDEDDQETDYGAETSYYRSLEIPYSCRNGPVEHIEELLLVKGITPVLLFGSETGSGLVDFLTVMESDGKININTAPLPVIKSFDPLISDELLDKLNEFRQDEANGESLSDLTWYKSVAGWPGDITLKPELMTVKSKYFQVTAIGKSDTLSRSVVAVAERSSDSEIKLLGKKRSNL